MTPTTYATAYTLGCKGLNDAHALATGELLISGYLTRWDELDRTADRMVRGAFLPSIPKFLSQASGAPLCWNHDRKTVLGRVLELGEDSIGVHMKAAVNAQPETSPLRWIYDAIKSRSVKGLSAGAIFKKLRRPDGSSDIVSADIIEASCTATPMLTSAGFEVVSEGKALDFGWSTERTADLDALAAEVAVLRFEAAIGSLDAALRTRS